MYLVNGYIQLAMHAHAFQRATNEFKHKLFLNLCFVLERRRQNQESYSKEFARGIRTAEQGR
jgi:hypothetical protein